MPIPGSLKEPLLPLPTEDPRKILLFSPWGRSARVGAGSQGIFYSDLDLKRENLNSKVKMNLTFILIRELRYKEQSDTGGFGFSYWFFNI